MTTFCEARPEVAAEDERNRMAIYGTGISKMSVAPRLFDHIFPAIGLPNHKYTAIDCDTLQDPTNIWARDMSLPSALGSCITMPLKIQAMTAVDEVTPQAAAIGSCNTTFFRTDSATGKIIHVGTNLDTAGVGNSLLTVLTGHSTPFPPTVPLTFAPGTASALMIGGGGATRAAIYAMHAIGLSPIYLVNRDLEETASIVEQFKDWDLRPLETVEEAKGALAKGEKEGVRLAAGVGAIPSIEPKTEAEKRVYEIAKTLFEHPYNASRVKAEEGFLSLPSKPVHLEMAYKPRMTIIRQIAEDRGWQTICGVEVVLEGCFEQCYLWTGKIVPSEVREGGRKILRQA
ncbi:hypothetical protein BCR35DRAFT_335500 [Leucosporidium creatinivorum]|uniref:Shikimate dehydrogenase substrate binding N-terminal domain-containing protein n=1 Tax=Leucosporidium creatinivorum TaxID=106004 RepID=A0A1Y2DAH2_9BASI|nr:hypothetical protein BCR35DRAFT_335500 [Leucosporidium creatinivorum]